MTELLKNSSELVPVPNPKMIYMKHKARVSTNLILLTLKKRNLMHVYTLMEDYYVISMEGYSFT